MSLGQTRPPVQSGQMSGTTEGTNKDVVNVAADEDKANVERDNKESVSEGTEGEGDKDTA